MLFKVRQTEESLEGRLLHLAHIGETHVVGDEQQDLLGVVVGKAEAAANFFRNADSHFHVPVKTNAVRGSAKGGRLPNVVQQRSPREGGRATSIQPVEQYQRMHPHIAFRVV